jgi:hypothetical protein
MSTGPLNMQEDKLRTTDHQYASQQIRQPPTESRFTSSTRSRCFAILVIKHCPNIYIYICVAAVLLIKHGELIKRHQYLISE